MGSKFLGGTPFAHHKRILHRRWFMWIAISLGIMAVLSAAFGIRGFFAGLLNVIGTSLYYLWKGFEILDFIAGVCDVLQVIFQILSLFG